MSMDGLFHGKSHRKPWINWGLAGLAPFLGNLHMFDILPCEFLHREPVAKKTSPKDKWRSQQPFELVCVTFIICQEDLVYMCQEISIIISLFNALMDSIGYLSIIYVHSQTCLKRLQISWPWRLYSVFQQYIYISLYIGLSMFCSFHLPEIWKHTLFCWMVFPCFFQESLLLMVDFQLPQGPQGITGPGRNIQRATANCDPNCPGVWPRSFWAPEPGSSRRLQG